MTNDELMAAIQYVFSCCDKTYAGGIGTVTTDANKAMLNHLKELLSVQLERAKK